uniref:F-box domain-containing protein n=1 Tax=Chenopodium quinoa TaxID=63459 RepID=A0A803L9K0_CHEQI
MSRKIAKSASMSSDNLTKNNSDETLTLVEHLIMEEILPRLPVKSLIRFKLVSKKWNSTISSLQFAKLHLNFSSQINRYFIMLPYNDQFCSTQQCGTYCLLPERDSSDVKDLVSFEDGVWDVGWHHMVDSSNGLVCLYQRDDDEDDRHCFFTIWNLATRQCRDIDSPKGVHVSVAHGFGYVSSLDDYVIVASFGCGTVDFSRFRGFYMFSLKAGQWKRVIGSYAYLQVNRWCWKWKRVRAGMEEESIARRLRDQAVLVGDVMYWAPAFSFNGEIAGFDVVTENLVKYPVLDWQSGYHELGLYQVNGCLSLSGSKKEDVTDFWMLKDPNDWSSWQKILSVDLTNISLITFSETGKFLVRKSNEFKLVEPCKESLECFKGKHTNYAHMVMTRDYVESLISPFGATEADQGIDNSEDNKHLSAESMHLENKRPSLSHKSENNSSIGSNDFCGQSNTNYCKRSFYFKISEQKGAGDWLVLREYSIGTKKVIGENGVKEGREN